MQATWFTNLSPRIKKRTTKIARPVESVGRDKAAKFWDKHKGTC